MSAVSAADRPCLSRGSTICVITLRTVKPLPSRSRFCDVVDFSQEGLGIVGVFNREGVATLILTVIIKVPANTRKGVIAALNKPFVCKYNDEFGARVCIVDGTVKEKMEREGSDCDEQPQC